MKMRIRLIVFLSFFVIGSVIYGQAKLKTFREELLKPLEKAVSSVEKDESESHFKTFEKRFYEDLKVLNYFLNAEALETLSTSVSETEKLYREKASEKELKRALEGLIFGINRLYETRRVAFDTVF